MSAASLRVPRQPPLPSPASWQKLVDMPGGAWEGSDETSSAVYYNGHTYFGYIDASGNIRVASYNHTTGSVTISPAIASGFFVDLHTGPGVLVRSSDRKILIAYCAQATNHMFIALSTNAEDVTSWGAPTDIQATLAGGGQYTYAYFTQLSGETGKIYLFYRDGIDTNGKLCYSTSTNGGSTWTSQTVLYQATNGPYWSINTDSVSRVDFAITDGNAASADVASVYHFYYTGGSYYKTDGTLISASLPFGPSNITKVYDGATNGTSSAPFGVVAAGGPYIVFPAANLAGWATNPENYWYAVYSGGSWHINQIIDTGIIPSIDIWEGGLALDKIDPTRVYVSRSSGGNYQIYLYRTSNGGSTWTSTQLTSDTGANQNWGVITPRDGVSDLRALWLSGIISPDSCPQNFVSKICSYPNREAPF